MEISSIANLMRESKGSDKVQCLGPETTLTDVMLDDVTLFHICCSSLASFFIMSLVLQRLTEEM